MRIGGLVAISCLVILSSLMLGCPSGLTVEVPVVLGLQRDAAEAAIAAEGLTVGTVTEVFDRTAPVGEVVSQRPAGGAVLLLGNAVDLTISEGQEPGGVPDCIGMSLADATATLTGAGFTVGRVTREFHATASIDRVLCQSPGGGAQRIPGTAVDLVVSKGVETPDVVTLAQAAATARITDRGLTVGVVSIQFHSTIPVGCVASQMPVAGTGVEPGSSVNLSISVGNALRVDVDTQATKAMQDGLTWDTAFDTIQEAIDAVEALGGGQVWVAAGTYAEERPDDPAGDGSLVLVSGVHVYGGFAGTETYLHEANWALNVTVIDGSNGRGPGVAAYHVVKGADNATLDGFTITGGNANGGATARRRGGGMYNDRASPTVTNCTFLWNSAEQGRGGGMYNDSASPAVTNCTFTANSAYYEGGGMYNDSASPTVANCTFTANSAGGGGGMFNWQSSSPTVTNCTFAGNSAGYGGGMYTYDSSPTVTNCAFAGNWSSGRGGGMWSDRASLTVANCTFTANSACGDGGGIGSWRLSSLTTTNCTFSANSARTGGGMYTYDSSPTVTNCTLTANSAEVGGGMRNDDASPTVTNCILWGDEDFGYAPEISNASSSPVVTYSCVEGGYGVPADENIDAHPQFVNADGGDLRLCAGSPCIDTGRDTSGAGYGTVIDDIRGVPRPQDGDGQGAGTTGDGSDYDMGAYEME